MSEIPARFNDGGAVSGRGGEERKKGLGFVMGEVRRDAIVVAEKEKERVKPYIYIYSINIYIYMCVCVCVCKYENMWQQRSILLHFSPTNALLK